MRSLLLALMTVLILTGCEGRRDDEAGDLVRSWLTQLASGAGDRGWSLLLPDTRRSVFADDKNAYTDQADAIDWSAFTWTIRYVEREEPHTYGVVITYGGELPSMVAAITDLEEDPRADGPTFTVWFHGVFGGDGIYQFES